jgi:hypothetical protein
MQQIKVITTQKHQRYKLLIINDNDECVIIDMIAQARDW